MARERIGLIGKEGVVPLGGCLVVDKVKRRTTLVVLGEVSVPLAPLPLDRLLSKGSGSYLAFGLLFPPGCIKLIGNLRTVILPSILKGLRSFCVVVIHSSSPVKIEIGVCRNLGRGLAIVVGSGAEASGGVGSSRIRSTGSSFCPICNMSI